jgi:hypothetical protein
MQSGAITALQGESFNRQLHGKEIDIIQANKRRFARYLSGELGREVGELEAEILLGTQAMSNVDTQWDDGSVNQLAQNFLTQLRNEAGNTFIDHTGRTVTYFSATEAERNDHKRYFETTQRGQYHEFYSKLEYPDQWLGDERANSLLGFALAGNPGTTPKPIAPKAGANASSTKTKSPADTGAEPDASSGGGGGGGGRVSDLGVDGEMAGLPPGNLRAFQEGRTQPAATVNLLHGEHRNAPPYKAGTVVTDELQPAGTRLYMVVDKDGNIAGWASTKPITSVAEARNNYAITPEFKPDVVLPDGSKVLYVQEVIVKPGTSLPTRTGTIGEQTYKGMTYQGGEKQVEILLPASERAKYLQPVGKAQVLR